METLPTHQAKYQWAWRASVLFFVLAGLTGFLFRFELAYGGSLGLHLANVRHAHSHLMFFGWATPALMLCIERFFPPDGQEGRSRPMLTLVLWWLFVLSALAYVAFFLRGYQPFEIEGRRLPLSVIVSGLHVVGWYGFIVHYFIRLRRRGEAVTNAPWDLALVLLGLATIGAWGLALHAPLGLEGAVWLVGLTHFFLDTFSEGWLVLGVLGLAYTDAAVRNRSSRGALYAYAFAVPFVYALAVPEDLVSPTLKVVARAAGVVAGASLLVHVWNLRTLMHRKGLLWVLPLFFLALKGGGQALLCALPDAWWPELGNLRILYIHVMLLGFVSLGISVSAHSTGFTTAKWRVFAFQVAAVVLLLGVALLTGIWPTAWANMVPLRLAAWLSLPAPFCALLLLRSRATNGRGR